MTAPTQPGVAAARQARNEIAALVAGRATTIAQVCAAASTLRTHVRRPGPLIAAAAVISAQSTWASWRAIRTGTVRSTRAGWSDVAACSLGLLSEATSWGTRDFPPDPRWSLPFSVVVAAWLPFELDGGDLAAGSLVWTAIYLASTTSRSPGRAAGRVQGQRYAEALAAPTTSFVFRNFSTELRTLAEQLDTARATAIVQMDQLARQAERGRQFRITHDAAVQVLEAVAGDWAVDEGALTSRVELEIRRLRRVLAGGSLGEGDDLVDLLTSVAAELELHGLEVTLESGGLTRQLSDRVATAVCESSREVLVNVVKHAGVSKAHIVAVDDPQGGVAVSIVDEGRGFDLAAPRKGFGLSESVTNRVVEVGGRVEIHSVPGGGTTVTIWAGC